MIQKWIAILIVLATGSAWGLGADEILRRSEEVRGPSGAFSFWVKAEDFDRQKSLRSTTYKVFSKGGKFSLVETQTPERLKGRKLLMNDVGLWLFLPTVNRPTRVSLQQRLTGEVANGDIAQAQFSADYRAELKGVEKIDGKSCFRLHLTPKGHPVTYPKIDYWVAEKTFQPVRADFFALSGKKLKTGTYGSLKNILGKDRVGDLKITDAMRPARQTKLSFYNHRRENLDDSFFNKESLLN